VADESPGARTWYVPAASLSLAFQGFSTFPVTTVLDPSTTVNSRETPLGIVSCPGWHPVTCTRSVPCELFDVPHPAMNELLTSAIAAAIVVPLAPRLPQCEIMT
jgi:hypothetical protein